MRPWQLHPYSIILPMSVLFDESQWYLANIQFVDFQTRQFWMYTITERV